MLVLILLTVVTGCLIYRYIRVHYQLFSKDGIPGPAPTPFIGNLAEFTDNNGNPLETFYRLCQEYGKVFGYYEGWTPCVVVSDPCLMEQILVKHFHHFDGRPNCWPFQHGAEHYALHNLNGPRWKRHREVIASVFRTGSIRKMWPRLQAAAERYVDRLEQQRNEHPEGFNVDEENESYSLEAFTSAAFDVAPSALREQDRKCMLQYMRSSHHSASPENPAAGLARVYPSLVPLLKILDYQHRRLAADYCDYVTCELRNEQLKMSESQGPSNLLQHILSARKKLQASDLSNPASLPSTVNLLEIQGMVLGLVGGGLGPASTALDFCVYCLAMYPQHQDTLVREILAHTPKLTQDRPLTMDEVQELQFLDMFVSECLRHFPVAPGVARTCLEDCVVGGVQFRKGTVVRMMGSVQYRDPLLYPHPHLFDPSRFSKAERQNRHPYTFIPFGAGPRMCVARRLGLLQVKVAIVSLLQRFKVIQCPLTSDPLTLTFKPFLCPKDGVWVNFELRSAGGR